MFVREIRVGCESNSFVRERERESSREGEWKQELCVCERQRGGVRLIGKQIMSIWDGDEKETTTNVLSTGERERVILVV